MSGTRLHVIIYFLCCLSQVPKLFPTTLADSRHSATEPNPSTTIDSNHDYMVINSMRIIVIFISSQFVIFYEPIEIKTGYFYDQPARNAHRLMPTSTADNRSH